VSEGRPEEPISGGCVTCQSQPHSLDTIYILPFFSTSEVLFISPVHI
jgi:hypothetical protein